MPLNRRRRAMIAAATAAALGAPVPVVLAADILSLTPAIWYRYNTGITAAGGFVSQWNDQSGGAHHLTQGVATNQLALNGDNTLSADGTDNYMISGAFALNQPEEAFMVTRQRLWAGGDPFFDGVALNTGRISQTGVSPFIGINAGTTVAPNNTLPINTWGIVRGTWNGAASSLQVGESAETTGDPGAANMGGFTLAARGDLAQFIGADYLEIIVFPAVLTEMNRVTVRRWLRQQAALASISL